MNREVASALALMDCGSEVKKVWRGLDDYVMDSNERLDQIESDGINFACQLHEAQQALAEAIYKRDWSDEWADLTAQMSTAMAQCPA